jgi:ectoine hydroxylase-related dioxygenase (phytanoyl-CoA dioxygenase family)
VTLLAELEGQGWSIVPGLLGPDDLAAVGRGFDHLWELARGLAESGDIGGARFVLDAEPFRLHRVVWCGGADERLAALGDDPRFLAIAAAVLGSREVVQILQQAHFKLPGDGVAFPWHQDASNRRYGTPEWTDVNGRGSFVQIAVAVDEMGPDNGGLRVIPGTHRLGHVADPAIGDLPPELVDEARAVDLHLAPGDAVVFGPFLVHGSAPNEGDRPRRLFLQGYASVGANRRVYPGCGVGVLRRA